MTERSAARSRCLRRAALSVLGISAALFLTLLTAPRAKACGGFFDRKAFEGGRRPSLAYEQALIVFDAEHRREHFVREIAFRAARDSFGFVVPTPARPEVAALKTSPFASLRSDFPFERKGFGAGLRLGAGGGGMAPGKGRGVQILEITKVGSFTAFVLAATDEAALGKWLAKNGFVSTPRTDAWLAHYVKLKFFYVAMRYDPPKDSAAKESAPQTKAETMRISFDTPLPYYPYFEPEPASPPAASDPRLLEVWLVSHAAFVPVAVREQAGRARWVRPLATGQSYDSDNRERLTSALGTEAALLPRSAAPLRVGRFMDQKRSRTGFGDIVFVPAEKRAFDEQTRRQLGPLLPIVDPKLMAAR
jgi:hypothetical protein